MPFTLDGDPLIGALDQRALAIDTRLNSALSSTAVGSNSSSVFVVGGMGGSGFMKGAMAGKLLAELIHQTDAHANANANADGAGEKPAAAAAVASMLKKADPNRFFAFGEGSSS